MSQTKFNASKIKQIRSWHIEIMLAENFESFKIMIKSSSHIHEREFIIFHDNKSIIFHNSKFIILHNNHIIKSLLHFMSWFWIIQNFQQTIFQCVIDEFVSFLRRWISFIQFYNMISLNMYHITEMMCLFETFNCMNQIEHWWLNFENSSFDTRFWL